MRGANVAIGGNVGTIGTIGSPNGTIGKSNGFLYSYSFMCIFQYFYHLLISSR